MSGVRKQWGGRRLAGRYSVGGSRGGGGLFAVAVVAWLGLAVGCLGSDQGTAKEEAAGRWCAALCDRARHCHGRVFDCEGSCLASNAEYFQRMGGSHLDREVACWGDPPADCDLEGMVEDCYRSSLRAAEPTPASAEFCFTMAQPFFECGWYSSPDACERDFGAFDANALAVRATECQSAECENLETCLFE